MSWAPERLDLAQTSVFLDFDGTITVADTGVHLLDRLAPPGWRSVGQGYAEGTMGSRECQTREWALLSHDEDLLRSVAREVPLDPGFVPLVEFLRQREAEVTVVSDGFGFRAAEVCAEVGVDLLTNEVDWGRGELGYPNADRCCPCASCGTCKQAPIRDARRRGRATVFVGDGISDCKAALLADVLFAKAALADWCDDVGVDYRPFSGLADVISGLGRLGA
ncbi:MAG TPA: HAD-IB family phosphatase [Acidimicrobiales bacterium]|nr:HAD-IB family phosphatase [Acidimicrobiales bacterium]